ncbi:MAG: hypothetical protein PHE58_00410 [Candidatus Omnitrophica bacterium]|nr:hypothetical protein [Candidatus Omnitrophota bacterium]
MNSITKICIVLAAVVIMCVSGCETVKDSAKGAAKDLEPVKQEVKKGYEKLEKVDRKMQEKLW